MAPVIPGSEKNRRGSRKKAAEHKVLGRLYGRRVSLRRILNDGEQQRLLQASQTFGNNLEVEEHMRTPHSRKCKPIEREDDGSMGRCSRRKAKNRTPFLESHDTVETENNAPCEKKLAYSERSNRKKGREITGRESQLAVASVQKWRPITPLQSSKTDRTAGNDATDCRSMEDEETVSPKGDGPNSVHAIVLDSVATESPASSLNIAEPGLHASPWSVEQEMALRKAYASIKPAADFWHVISKRVPGRTAAECFDKFYSAHPTPPAPQRHGRGLITPSMLRETSSGSPRDPAKKSTFTSDPSKRSRFTSKRQSLLEARRTIRFVLRKQQTTDRENDLDVFEALENPISEKSPLLNRKRSSVLDVGPQLGSKRPRRTQIPLREGRLLHEVSDKSTPVMKENRLLPSAHSISTSTPIMKENSQFPSADLLCTSTPVMKENRLLPSAGLHSTVAAHSRFCSPEVLKRMKDLEHHDKYLDQLHQRLKRKPRTHKQIVESCEKVEFADGIARAKQKLRNVFLNAEIEPRAESEGEADSGDDEDIHLVDDEDIHLVDDDY